MLLLFLLQMGVFFTLTDNNYENSEGSRSTYQDYTRQVVIMILTNRHLVVLLFLSLENKYFLGTPPPLESILLYNLISPIPAYPLFFLTIDRIMQG